jgi:hypothetical protein
MKYILYKEDRDKIRKAIYQYLNGLDDKTYQIVISEYDDGRSSQQNRLYYSLLKELSEQGDSTIDEYRAISKLHIGVPIMRTDDEFRARYDKVIKPMPYETKLELMRMDFPVTSLMTVEQMQTFIDNFYAYWSGKGFILSEVAS